MDTAFFLRHNQPAPRYTSYPTVPHWQDDAEERVFLEAIAALRGRASAYVHVPFCRSQCLYCGCNMVVAGRQDVGDRYVDALATQVAEWPIHRSVHADRVHLGGGTPTWLSPRQLQRLMALVRETVAHDADTQISIEVSPDSVTRAHLDVLAAAGVSRISIGVQSLDPRVQQAVQRTVEPGVVARLVDDARERGISSVNLDLMYGLPGQDVASFSRTLDRVLSMQPDRLAVFGYAHVPWMKRHQRTIDADELPRTRARLALWRTAQERLGQLGYEAIGFDHFARRGDPLATAHREQQLGRDFMGYTTRPGGALLGMGMSAISEFDDRYVQASARLRTWLDAAEVGRVAVDRVGFLTREDRLRRDVIRGVLCSAGVRYAAIESAYGIDFEHHFADEIRRLDPFIADGMVEITEEGIGVLEPGRLFARSVALVFDAYVPEGADLQRFSTVI